jgi:Rha family phage regulatory protein
MYDLTIISKDGANYIDSREVAKAIGKRHDHLLRDIRGYAEIIGLRGDPNFGVSDFFLESEYQTAQNQSKLCYLISKMGCELVANKLTGEKGVLFTAAYVAKFNEMEEAQFAVLEYEFARLNGEIAALGAAIEQPPPRLSELNSCARIVVNAMRKAASAPLHVLEFLKGLYGQLGISIIIDDSHEYAPRLYTASQIAEELGIYSVNENPHCQAVSCILNEIIFITEGHKTIEAEDFGSHISFCARYDDYALELVRQWIEDYEYPDEIYGFDRTYYVLYR